VSITQQSRIFLNLASFNLKVKQYVASKRRQLSTSRHGATFQKTQFFTSTTVKTHSLEMLSSFAHFLCIIFRQSGLCSNYEQFIVEKKLWAENIWGVDYGDIVVVSVASRTPSNTY
jgi:hypothetical protein